MPDTDDPKTEHKILCCIGELNASLTGVLDHHAPQIVVRALATQLGAGLNAVLESGFCTHEQVRSVLQNLEEQAFCGRPFDLNPGSNPEPP